MDKLYNDISYNIGKVITQAYSTSFSLSILMLGKEVRKPIYGIYGFVRLADEIVDTYSGANKGELLERFKSDTYQAIVEGVSLNPVLHAFQMVVNQYDITHDLIDAFFNSMKMDLTENSHDHDSYDQYIYGSAEVVGLMCLKIFVNGDTTRYDELKGSAQKLGAAFQKVNFLRDLKDDYIGRGRVYFPGLQYEVLTEECMAAIYLEIEKDFDDAFEGIINLPDNARFGVYTAYTYYRRLYNKIRKLQVAELIKARIRVPNYEKVSMIITNYVKLNLV